jgi:hypothetical protein
MSKEYAEECIRKALKECKGHPIKAQQKIIAEAGQDQRLLLSLTHGHLTGIVALWINRVVSRQAHEQEEVNSEEPHSLDMKPETFGKEILTILQNKDTVQFGKENHLPTSKRTKASKQHIETLKMLANKHKSKK